MNQNKLKRALSDIAREIAAELGATYLGLEESRHFLLRFRTAAGTTIKVAAACTPRDFTETVDHTRQQIRRLLQADARRTSL